MQIEKPLQRHGGRLERNETYCGSCYGAEMACPYLAFLFLWLISLFLHFCAFILRRLIQITISFYKFYACCNGFDSDISQSDDDCCNSCEEVREAYRKKGWGLTNADLIDQVGWLMLKYFGCDAWFLLDSGEDSRSIQLIKEEHWSNQLG